MRSCNRIVVALSLGLGLILVLLWSLREPSKPAVAASRTDKHIEEFNPSTNELHVCFSGCVYSSIQSAVDAANEGDIIKVATGTYTDVQSRPSPPGYNGPLVITQVVYISKTVTIRGGYTTTNWITSHPFTYPTTVNAQGQGRGLFIYGNISSTIEGLQIVNGEAVGLGGRVDDFSGSHNDTGAGVYVFEATVNLLNNIISDNRVSFSYVAYDGGGAGVYLAYSNSKLVNNVVVSNVVSNKYGGGLWAYKGNITLEDNTISYNQAFQGAGVHLEEITAVLANNTLSNNQTWEMMGGGGGLYTQASTATLIGNVISDNFGDAYGGGIEVIESNISTVNDVIIDNNVSYSGSGIYAMKSDLRMYHTTIARNAGGDTSGIYIYQGSALLTNTIIAEHRVGVLVNNDSVAELNGVLWYSNTTNAGNGGLVTVTSAYTGNPVFAADGYHLTSGSKAIDKGVDAGIGSDIDGDLRSDGFPDLGADEYSYPALKVTKQVYPDSVYPGAQLTYTIRVTNTGNMNLNVIITDTLPVSVTLGKTSGGTLRLPGGTVVLPDGRLTVIWTAVIPTPNGVWTGTIVATAEDYKGPLTNLVEVTTKEGAVGSARVIVNPYKIYLPLLSRSYLQD